MIDFEKTAKGETNKMDCSIRQQLLALAEPSYQKFSSSLLPGVDNLLGVRIPKLRKMAKELAKGDWRAYLQDAQEDTFEETMLQGMVIGYADTDFEERLRYVADFVPKISNWSLCDSFCSGLKKLSAQNSQRLWEFLQPYLKDTREYFVRFGVIMLRTYYLDQDHVDRVFELLDAVSHEGYYAKMAVAWTLCDCYIKFSEKTSAYFQHHTLDAFTYQKALQKITESRCVDSETKKRIRKLKQENCPSQKA